MAPTSGSALAMPMGRTTSETWSGSANANLQQFLAVIAKQFEFSSVNSPKTWKVDEGDVVVDVVSAPGLVNDDAAVSRAFGGEKSFESD